MAAPETHDEGGPRDSMWAAVVQLRSTMDVEANFAAMRRYVAEAAAAGAEVVALPENAAFLRTGREGTWPVEGLDGALAGRYRAMAREARAWLVVGSFAERGPDADHFYNTTLVIDGTRADAPIVGTYRKMHLFDIDVAGGESQRESDYIAAGDSPSLVDVAGVPTGLSICYDLRFPRLYQALVDRGAQLLTVPAAFTEFTGKDHWLVLLRARAIETQCFVLAPNQFGHHGGKLRSFGKSAIIDPWGVPLAIAPDRPGWTMARLDLSQLREIRASLPSLKNRHPKL